MLKRYRLISTKPRLVSAIGKSGRPITVYLCEGQTFRSNKAPAYVDRDYVEVVADPVNLQKLTRAQLIQLAKANGLSPGKNWKRAKIIEAIEAPP